MDAKPVEIKIKDTKRFGDVAFLIDRSLFLEAICKLRESFLIDQDFKESYVEFIYRLGDSKLKEKFDSEINKIRSSFRYPITFNKAIKKAIICNKVEESDYKTAYLDLVPTKNDPDDPDLQYAIFISPETTKKDINEVFDKFTKDLKITRRNKKKRHFTIDYATYFPGPTIDYDTKQELSRDRHWYWLNISENLSPLKIARLELENKNFNVSEANLKDLVKQALRRYKKNLQGYI